MRQLLRRHFAKTRLNGEKDDQPHRSSDERAWEHPYLTASNLGRFRQYSEEIWTFALDYDRRQTKPFSCAFAVNLAQNMHKWARLAQQYGVRATLFPNMQDTSAISCPEWEHFDGEYPDASDGKGFLAQAGQIQLDVPCERIPLEGSELYESYQQFRRGNRVPLLQLLAQSPGLRHELFLTYDGFYPYYRWAKALSVFDVIYAANTPFAAYASGRPFCAFATGGDVKDACGRNDVLGTVMSLSFNAARFLLVTNPHVISHSRRLGFTNGVYLPYPMDASRYCPGKGDSRLTWEMSYGKGIYVLVTSRLDSLVKGYDEQLVQALVKIARERPQVRFVFMAWGHNLSQVKELVASCGVGTQFIFLNPAGKKRLIDYYRSSDVVLDQFVYGYYGAAGLEAAAIGKPVIMKLRAEHYAPLYAGDVAPVLHAGSPEAVGAALLKLIDHKELRLTKGREMRDWLLRTHGEEKTVPRMVALLRVTADRVPLPRDLVSPLLDPVSESEQSYHSTCRVS